MTGTIVALDYSDPAEGAPAWFVPTTDVDAARRLVREHVAAEAGRDVASISTVVVTEGADPSLDLPTLDPPADGNPNWCGEDECPHCQGHAVGPPGSPDCPTLEEASR